MSKEKLGFVGKTILGLASFGLALFPQRVDAQRITQASIDCRAELDENGEVVHHMVGHLKVKEIPTDERYIIWFYLEDNELEKAVILGSNRDGEDTYEKEIIDGHKDLTFRPGVSYTYSIVYPGLLEDELIGIATITAPENCS